MSASRFIKCVTVGDGAVGKTCMLISYTSNTFPTASKENMLLEDRISELPPDILVHIVSQLKMDEAGRTSILSRRWRYMWTSIVNLEFNASHVLDDLKREIKCLEVERPIYINYVNQVIRNHQAQTIDKFVVVFSLSERSAPDIDRWVSFAARKKVKSLKLELRNHGGYTQLNCYNFPHSPEILRCSSLTSFHLDEINVSGELLELLLCNCLNLERVFVSRSTTLVSLNVDGPSPGLKLKWLDLHFCHNIKCLNVSAPNLVSFKYTGPKIPMLLKNVPKLLEISLTGLCSYYLLPCLSELSSYLPQLEKLELKSCEIKKHLEDRFPVIPKVKHLALTMVKTDYRSLLDYTSMIKACPSLYKFSFKVVYWDDKFEARETYKVKDCPHNIRVVEFIRFCGRMLEVQLAMYLIENAVMLEKITFYTVHGGPQNGSEPDEAQISASACARQLGKMLPPSVELHIV